MVQVVRTAIKDEFFNMQSIRCTHKLCVVGNTREAVRAVLTRKYQKGVGAKLLGASKGGRIKGFIYFSEMGAAWIAWSDIYQNREIDVFVQNEIERDMAVQYLNDPQKIQREKSSLQ